MHVRVHHAGCGFTPWHDGRPGCYEKWIPANTELGSTDPDDNLVYRPSSWVINFGEWWQLIKDGLKLITDLGIIFLKKSVSWDELIDIISDVFAIARDTVELAMNEDMSDEEKEEILQKCYDSVENTCKLNNLDLEEIKSLAKDMNLEEGAWGLLAGDAYDYYVHSNDSPVNGDHGWSVFCGWGEKHDDLYMASGCFIEKGHLIYPTDLKSEPKYGSLPQLWDKGFDN